MIDMCKQIVLLIRIIHIHHILLIYYQYSLIQGDKSFLVSIYLFIYLFCAMSEVFLLELDGFVSSYGSCCNSFRSLNQSEVCFRSYNPESRCCLTASGCGGGGGGAGGGSNMQDAPTLPCVQSQPSAGGRL